MITMIRMNHFAYFLGIDNYHFAIKSVSLFTVRQILN